MDPYDPKYWFGPGTIRPVSGTLSASVLQNTKEKNPNSEEFGNSPVCDVKFTPEYHLHSLLI